MSLRDEIAADTGDRGIGCSVCIWIAARPDEEDWPGIMGDAELGHQAIYRAMRSRGYSRSSSKPIETHRNNEHPPRGD